MHFKFNNLLWLVLLLVACTSAQATTVDPASAPHGHHARPNLALEQPAAIGESAFDRAAGRIRLFRAQFPTLLDDYVLGEFSVYFGLILASFLILLLVFTLFELLGDILRNQISPLIVGEYLLNVSPYFLYQITHIGMLLAVLVTMDDAGKPSVCATASATVVSSA